MTDSGKLIKANGEASGNGSHSLDYSYPAAVPYGYGVTQAPPPALLDYWHIVIKRKAVIGITFVIVFVLMAINTFRSPKLYEAAGSIALYHDAAQMVELKNGSSVDTDDWDYTVAVETQVRIMQSDALALKVARDLGMDKELLAPQNSSAGAIPLTSSNQLTPGQESALISQVHGNVQIAPIANTRMIALHYWSPDPQLAAKALNTFMDDYIQENIRSRYESAVQSSEWLSKQLTDLQLKVETSQEKLVQYQKANDILGLDEKQNIITAKLADLNKGLTEATGERIQKQALYERSQGSNPELVDRNDSTALISQLHARQTDLKNSYAQESTQFGPSYPKVEELENQLKEIQNAIDTENTRIANRFHNEYLTAAQREHLLQQAFERQKQQANTLNERAIKYSLLKRDLDTNQQLYDGILQKLKEAGVAAGLKSSNIRIVDPARVPTFPSKPDVPRNLWLGFLFGLMGGVVLAFVVEVLDNTIRTPEQVQVVSSLPSLGIVPMNIPLNGNGENGRSLLPRSSSGKARVELIAHSHPKSEIAESYRALRTSILLSSLGSPPQVILVTSALPQEGKTTTSLNCAIVLAQQGGRVLLVDADLRRPSVHDSLGLPNDVGLSSVLTGQCSAEEAMVRSTQLSNLRVLPAGPNPPHPAELLSSGNMKDLIKKWRGEFDHIIIDTPPALSVTDAVALSVDADSVVLVIRSGFTSKEALRRARDLLLRVNAKVMGVVVNAVDLRAPDLHRYYYSGAGYGAGYHDDSTTRK